MRQRTLQAVRTNLPASTTALIGREDELAVLLELMATARLVTVSGPGGSGKTHIAVEVARRAAAGFDAVWWVGLDHILDPNEVMGAVARVMGLPELAGVDADERVLDHLRVRNALLVLDSLEHVIDVAPLIGQLARAGPEVRVLVTSRLPLRVAGENVLALDPLPVPTGSERELAALREVASVALLCERAASGSTAWQHDADKLFDVARLCRQLDGLPLALELAAPRLRDHDATTISRALEATLDALDAEGTELPARERGLRAMLEWSVGLLADAERSLLAQLGVFSAGFTAPLVEAAFGEVADELQALVEAGLVRPAGGGRFQMLPPVRHFAAGLLDAEAEDAAHAAITDALIALAEPFEKRWVVSSAEGRAILDPEGGNVFAELDWAQLMDYGRHSRLAAATGWWLSHSGAAEFIRDHLEIALARSTGPVMRARCLQALGTLGGKDSDPTGCLDAADAWHDLGDAEGEFYSAVFAASLYGDAGEGEAQLEVLERCTELAARLPDDHDAEWILAVLSAEATALLGHPEDAIEPLLARFAEAPAGSLEQSSIASRLAGLELAAHRPAEALAHYGMAIGAAAALGRPLDQLIQATMIAADLVQLGRSEEAATAWAVCELGFDELSWSPHGELRDWYEAVRDSVGEDAVAAARPRASQMGMERGLAWVGDVALGAH
jgi:predicted ATPase